jgi:hypothetical protein
LGILNNLNSSSHVKDTLHACFLVFQAACGGFLGRLIGKPSKENKERSGPVRSVAGQNGTPVINPLLS